MIVILGILEFLTLLREEERLRATVYLKHSKKQNICQDALRITRGAHDEYTRYFTRPSFHPDEILSVIIVQRYIYIYIYYGYDYMYIYIHVNMQTVVLFAKIFAFLNNIKRKLSPFEFLVKQLTQLLFVIKIEKITDVPAGARREVYTKSYIPPGPVLTYGHRFARYNYIS